VILFFIDASGTAAVYTAMVLICFGAGATFPVVLNFIGSAFRELSGTAFSIAMFIGLCGQSFGNKFMGMQFDGAHYTTLPLTLIVCVVVMVILVPLAVKVSKK
jgi:cyanate permease